MIGRLALLAAVLLPVAGFAQQSAPATGSAVGYPNNPQGTPQARSAGQPVVTNAAACPAGSPCPGSPLPSAAADSGTTGVLQAGGIRTPATAYPNDPVRTPAADPSGKVPKP